MSKKEIVVVLGMHRSGTSLVTHIISESGYDAGTNLLGPKADNVEGFFEDIDIYQFNSHLCDFLGITWKSTEEFYLHPTNILNDLIDNEFEIKALEILNTKLLVSNKIVIKEPRMSILLPFWEKVFKQLNISIKYVFSVRNPVAIEQSLIKRDALKSYDASALWYIYNYEIISCASFDMYVVEYEDLLQNPKKVINRLWDYLKVDETLDIDEVIKLVKSNLNHSKSNDRSNFQYVENFYLDLVKIKNTVIKSDYKSVLQQKYWIISFSDFKSDENSVNQAQLYYDEGQGFSEESSISNSYEGKSFSKTYEIDEDSEITSLRFDPANTKCIVIMNQATLISKAGQFEVKVVSGNYFYCYNNIYFFDTSDPQLFFAKHSNVITKINISYKVFYDDLVSIKYLDFIRFYILERENKKLQNENGFEEYVGLISDNIDRKTKELNDKLTSQIQLVKSSHESKFEVLNKQIDETNKKVLDRVNNGIESVRLQKEEQLKEIGETIENKTNEILSQLKDEISLVNIDYRNHLETLKDVINIKINKSFNNIHNEMELTSDRYKNEIKMLDQNINQQIEKVSRLVDAKIAQKSGLLINSLNTIENRSFIKNEKLYDQMTVQVQNTKSEIQSVLCSEIEGVNIKLTREIENKIKQVENFISKLEMQNNKEKDDFKQMIRQIQDEHKMQRDIERRKLILRYKILSPLIVIKRMITFIMHPIKTSRLNRDINMIKKSGLFDESFYINRYEDIAVSHVDLVRHFCIFGWKRGFLPNSSFDVGYYLTKYGNQVGQSNPLVYYLSNQDTFQNEVEEHADIIKRSGLFNEDFYLIEYPDVKSSGIDPAFHYAGTGWREGRNPSPGFSTNDYLNLHLDVKHAEINPLLHYIWAGFHEGRSKTLADSSAPFVSPVLTENINFEKSDDFESELYTDLSEEDLETHVIAVHLPQFHPIKENDEWWGTGFTEWTNVSKAKPLFSSHYQPHIPLNGFYDLRLKDNIVNQVDLAKKTGVRGFCFYHYWFGGRRLLERPVNIFLENQDIDFPFCLCWANENWTRRWDGLDQEILIKQEHSPEDDIAFIEDLSKYLTDSRYIKIDNKPLVIVYRPGLLPNAAETAKRWRDYCYDNGIGDIYIAMVQGFGEADPRKFEFDAAIEFPLLDGGLELVNNDFDNRHEFGGHIFSLEDMANRTMEKELPEFDFYRTVIPSWDNTARKGQKGTVFTKSSPELYRRWLENAIRFTKAYNSQEKQFVFINAWNEWAEGNHLEPDRRYGYAYLNATQKAFCHDKILLVGHDAYQHGAQILLLNIAKEYKRRAYDVVVILLEGGELIDDYQSVCPTFVYDNDSITQKIEDLKLEGYSKAICNTIVSGQIPDILKRYNYSVVSLVHEMISIIRKYELVDHAKALAKSSDLVIFPSSVVKSSFDTIIDFDYKSLIQPQGMFFRNKYKENPRIAQKQLRSKYGISEKAKIILGVGYADHRKGFDLFIKTAQKCDSTYQFLWVGKKEEKLFNSISSNLDLIPNFHWEQSFISDLSMYYAGADLFLLTSREDPFPLVVMEAMDASCPVVAFKNAGGFVDIVNDDTGRLCEFEDASEMAEAVKFIFSEKGLYQNLEKNTKSLVEKSFSVDKYISTINSIFKEKKISVVVPNYNYGKYMVERLNSILNQDYPIFELIILDDCSTDNSDLIIQDWILENKNRINIIYERNTQNTGNVFKQWNKGVRMASGDYIWIAEADDLSKSNFLKELAGSLNDDVVLTYCDSLQIDEDGNKLADNYRYYLDSFDENHWDSDYCNSGTEEISNYLCQSNTILNVSSTLLKKYDGIEKDIDEASTHPSAGDWFFYLKCLKHGHIKFLAKSLNIHRRHSGSVTSKASKTAIAEVETIHRYCLENFNIKKKQQIKMKEIVAKMRKG